MPGSMAARLVQLLAHRHGARRLPAYSLPQTQCEVVGIIKILDESIKYLHRCRDPVVLCLIFLGLTFSAVERISLVTQWWEMCRKL